LDQKNDNYILHIDGERQYLTFPKLDSYKELRHAFTTRHGGVSSGCVSTWNFGERKLDSEENILRNFEILADVMGTTADKMVLTYQTHTVNIRKVTKEDAGRGVTRDWGYRDVDGLVTDEKDLTIITTHADCNAVFFYDPVKKVIGLAHSGWRGTFGGISREMVDIMKREYGTEPKDLVCGIGPSLCKDCFEVDEDVAEAFRDADPDYEAFIERRDPKYHIDLKAIIRHDLVKKGVKDENVLDMGLCTKCNKDDFFSHRGHKGKRGLMVAAMRLAE
jgi:YfiH family protein